MKKEVFIICGLLVFLIAVFLWTSVPQTRAQEETVVIQKLDQILQNQAKIMEELNQIKIEVGKIKFRV